MQSRLVPNPPLDGRFLAPRSGYKVHQHAGVVTGPVKGDPTIPLPIVIYLRCESLAVSLGSLPLPVHTITSFPACFKTIW
jgi:hypothetical protein